MGRSVVEQKAHPGATKDVPLVDAEVLTQLLDVLDEVPRRVLLDAREPERRAASISRCTGYYHRSQSGSRCRLARAPLVKENDLQEARDRVSYLTARYRNKKRTPCTWWD